MSKVARKPVLIPENIKFSVNENLINIEGPMGKLSFVKNDNIAVVIEDGNAQVKTKNSEFIPLSGTTRALIFNMVHGVTKGWTKKLKMIGVGYRAKADLKKEQERLNEEMVKMKMGWKYYVFFWQRDKARKQIAKIAAINKQLEQEEAAKKLEAKSA